MIQRSADSMTLNKTYVCDALLLNTACLERKQQLFTSAQCVQDDVTRLKKTKKIIAMQTPWQLYHEICTSTILSIWGQQQRN